MSYYLMLCRNFLWQSTRSLGLSSILLKFFRHRQIAGLFGVCVHQILTRMASSPFPRSVLSPFCNLVTTIFIICNSVGILFSCTHSRTSCQAPLSTLELSKPSSPTFPKLYRSSKDTNTKTIWPCLVAHFPDTNFLY